MSTATLPSRMQFPALVRQLERCSDPYSVAAQLMVEALGMVEELRQEMNALLDDLVSVARSRKVRLPEAGIAAVQEDLHTMGRLREHYELDVLFSTETRERCGHCAVPLLAMAVLLVWNEVTFGNEGLERAHLCTSMVAAVLGGSPVLGRVHPARQQSLRQYVGEGI